MELCPQRTEATQMNQPELRIDGSYPNQRLRWQAPETGRVLNELLVPVTQSGCAIEEFSISPSGAWIATARFSGQGEWGYDVIKAHPLSVQGGIAERYGYMLDIPVFAEDESRLLGGYGESWLGGWWSHPEDDFYEVPARGGDVTFGWLFTHHLPSHRVDFHELRMTIPAGWFPDDPEAEKWFGPRHIQPYCQGAKMLLPGTIPFEIEGPLQPVIQLPMPHPEGGEYLT